jgi:hypothetical protein
LEILIKNGHRAGRVTRDLLLFSWLSSN